MIPEPIKPKDHKVKKVSKTKEQAAPEKSKMEKTVKATSSIVKPNYSIVLAACTAYQVRVLA